MPVPAEFDLGFHVQPVDRLSAAGQGLERGCQTEIIEGRRAELGDQVSQAIDLVAEPLEDVVDSSAESVLVVDIPGVGKLQAQRPDALDALVVDLAGPACPLALARLHAVAQSFDLDRALGHQPDRDALREGRQRLLVRPSEAAVATQRDHQPAAVALHRQRLDQDRPGFEPQFVQESGLGAAGTVERDRLALREQCPQGAPLPRGYPQPYAAAAGGGDAQLVLFLDHDYQRARVEQRQTAVGHQAQQPQLGSGEHRG